MKKQKVLLILMASLFTIICTSMVLVQAFSVPLFAPEIITFGSSSEVQTTTETVLGLYPNAQVIKYEDIGNILNVLTLMRSYSQLLLIGHGSAKGILTATGKIIPWENIAQWVNSLPNTNVYFLSCDSNSVTKLVNKPSYGFTGVVDGPMAADIVGVIDNKNHGLDPNTNNALSNLIDRIFSISMGAKLNLLYTASPYSNAFKSDHKTIINWLSSQITNVFWLSMDAQNCNTFKLGVAIGGGALAAILSVITGSAGLGPYGSVVGFLFGVLVALYIANIGETAVQTPDHHCVIGLGTEIVPVQAFQLWFDYGSKQQGIGPIPAAQFIWELVALYGAIDQLPRSWTQMINFPAV